ncbi:hypothetical protein [Maridesulfovibrio sp.]|uniref:hypothetical protein n=1 Tax=Maridesulfovibrio sp. TaxID=2795000 RepID=UPI0039F14D86
MSTPVFSTIFRSSVIWEVRLLQQKLESEGIKSFVDDENINRDKPYLSHAFGGIGLKVYTEDARRALEIIKHVQPQKNPSKCRATCPKCGNNSAYRLKWPQKEFYAALIFLGIPFLFFDRLGCTKCNNIWYG